MEMFGDGQGDGAAMVAISSEDKRMGRSILIIWVVLFLLVYCLYALFCYVLVVSCSSLFSFVYYLCAQSCIIL